MNARKYAWQFLHAEIRRRAGEDHEHSELHPELVNMGVLERQAREDGVNAFDIIFELARFGATYALMPRSDNDPLAVADKIELGVMSESDEVDDYKDDARWFSEWAKEHPLTDEADEPDDEDKAK